MRRTAINNQWWKIPLHLTYALTSRVVGKPQMILQPVSSIFLSTALWDLANSRPVHSLMLSSHLFFCLPCLPPPFTEPCKMFLARPDERETFPYHSSLRLFTMVRRSSWGLTACWSVEEWEPIKLNATLSLPGWFRIQMGCGVSHFNVSLLVS